MIEACKTCSAKNKMTIEGVSNCFKCDNFSSSKYLDDLITAIENGEIDPDSDVMKEYGRRCPSGKCGKRAREDVSLVDRVMTSVVEGVGTAWCVLAFVIIATIPLIWPATMPVIGYLSSGYLQLILLPIISVGQIIQEKRSAVKARIDFRAQLKSEIEIQHVIWRLEKIENMITDLATKLK